MSKTRLTNPKHRKHNVGDQKQVLHMGFEAKHKFQFKKMRFNFRLPTRFTLLSNAWLQVSQEPYPKFANVRWISFDLHQTHLLHTIQIPWSFEDLLFR
jgi:hypothetical protein